MTFVAAMVGADSIWLLADRRLSAGGLARRDDASKIMSLETVDGVALLGYAGLGATPAGTEPSEWMARVLRGRNLTMEASLGAITDAARTQIPRHLTRAPRGTASHTIVVPAFVDDKGHLYTIDIVMLADRASFFWRYTKHVDPRSALPAPLAFAGSGASAFMASRDFAAQVKSLHRLLKAHDRGAVSSLFVADSLANLNEVVRQESRDNTVGPQCIVHWRYRRRSRFGGGGAFQYYSRGIRAQEGDGVPIIVNGMDLRALVAATMPFTERRLEALREGRDLEDDTEAINEALRRMPNTPDDNLK